jgi:AraC family transcriptional regulator of adaptative response/methylated-DNA-[protein]-cysteine methyltransferase
MNDYDRIAAVIRYLDEHSAEQPSLSQLAAAAGLSESHFHRLFHRWAGVTPKDFLQCLTVENAKQRLHDSASVLDAALDSGLSGPGRLHDLLVTIEAASPGEIKSGGAGMVIEWGIAESPFGLCSIGWSARGICHLEFREVEERFEEPSTLRTMWPKAELRQNNREARNRASRIFNPDATSPKPLKAYVRGTGFQLKVWRALLQIPEGCVTSYRRLAEAVCDSNAARAVGTACGANPVGYLIPCHRVIRETGVVRGYKWGETRKRALLARENIKFLPHRRFETAHDNRVALK